MCLYDHFCKGKKYLVGCINYSIIGLMGTFDIFYYSFFARKCSCSCCDAVPAIITSAAALFLSLLTMLLMLLQLHCHCSCSCTYHCTATEAIVAPALLLSMLLMLAIHGDSKESLQSYCPHTVMAA